MRYSVLSSDNLACQYATSRLWIFTITSNLLDNFLQYYNIFKVPLFQNWTEVGIKVELLCNQMRMKSTLSCLVLFTHTRFEV